MFCAVGANDTLRRATQHERRTATRAALMASAVELIVKSGPSVSVGQIAASAGMSKGAFQHHFASKADLLTAVVVDGWNDAVERLAVPPELTGTVEERVRELVDVSWESYQQPACLAAFVVSTDPNLGNDLRAELTAGFHDMRSQLDECWDAWFADLDLDPAGVRNARRFVRSHVLGMLTQRRLPHGEPPADEELDWLCVAASALLVPSHAPPGRAS